MEDPYLGWNFLDAFHSTRLRLKPARENKKWMLSKVCLLLSIIMLSVCGGGENLEGKEEEEEEKPPVG